ncbi:MAG TPA: ATP-binding protein [Pyrinomonadaceae bacterium]|nr:ATP-binding protein [Pyrinomonadaceae bacterium]
MGIRLKLLLLFLAFGFLPMLALNVINYQYGVSTAEEMLKSDAARDTASIARNVETALREREAELKLLARSPALSEYLRSRTAKVPQAAAQGSNAQGSDVGGVPKDVANEVGSFFFWNQKYYAAITCLNQKGEVLFRLEPPSREGLVRYDSDFDFKTRDFLPGMAQPDGRVWMTAKLEALSSGVERETYGASVRYTVPLFTGDENADAERGALVADVKLDRILEESARAVEGAEAQPASTASRASSLVVFVDRTGRIVYHTNYALKFQPVSSALPSFKAVSDAMAAQPGGFMYYTSPDGDQLLAAFQRISSLDLSLATSRSYSLAVGGLRRVGWIILGLTLLVGLVTALLLNMLLRRTAESIEQVTQGAAAVAAGDLNQRIELTKSNDAYVLAESFNQMTDRLREQIAREAEGRQFASFLRLSAMLTHDLKNAIASLSLLVRNMEHQFHQEEFRADAMRSLTEATDKLRNLVSKLSEPVRSMSGEFGRPRPTDLVPVIRRVLNTAAGPYSTQHKVETELPEALVASVDAERMEKVVENLVLNAFEAMGSAAGTLTIDGGLLPGEKVFFGVRDTGPGMSEDFQHKQLFRPFATTKKKGVGLGLYTCREVVRAHGGEIQVESQKGVGTYFRVVLPSKQVTDREGIESRTSQQKRL